MDSPNYLNFSRVDGKATLNRRTEKALAALEEILDAPHAAKKNLMETNFKAAVATGNILKTIIQGESANAMTMALMDSRTHSNGELIEANVPGIRVPKKLKA